MRPRFWILAAALVVCAAWFIWPRPYREYRLGTARIIRVNRLTGKTEQLHASGWEPVEPKA